MLDRVEPVYFFMHIMKTAGTSFVRLLIDQFSPDQIYPPPEPERPAQEYWVLDHLRALDDADRQAIRLYHGHFPFVVSTMVGADTTFTILRDPVERVISHMRHFHREFERYEGKPLDAVYDDDWHRPTQLQDYQVKQFAMTLDDPLAGHIDLIDVDEERFKIALDNLERVTVFGFTEAYDELMADVERRFGWTPSRGGRLRVSERDAVVSPALRRRIVADNQADIEFYAQARSEYLRRGGRLPR